MRGITSITAAHAAESVRRQELGGAAAGLPASYSSAANQREAVHSSDGLTVSPINFLKGRKQTDYLAGSLDLPIRSVLLLANHNR